MEDWSQLRRRVSDKWQLPLLALSVLTLIGSFLSIKPKARDYPIPEAIKQLDVLIAGGACSAALRLAEPLPALEGIGESELAGVYLRLARATIGLAMQQRRQDADTGARVEEYFEIARKHGEPLTPHDVELLGAALEWQGHFIRAVQAYEQSLAACDAPSIDLKRHLTELRLDSLEAEPAEALQLLAALTEEAGDRLDIRLWAIERSLDVLETLGRSAEGATLLARYADAFEGSLLHDRFTYLQALVMVHTGGRDEAETLLRVLRNRVSPLDEVNAMSGWLLGRVVLGEDGLERPLEAISFFENVIATHPPGPYRAASRLGLAEALASLQRDEDALYTYRIAIDEAALFPDARPINRDVVRVSLSVFSERMRQRGRLEAALGYRELAGGLIDHGDTALWSGHLERLGELHEALAEDSTRRATRALDTAGLAPEVGQDELRGVDGAPQARAGSLDPPLPPPERGGSQDEEPTALLDNARGHNAAAADAYVELVQALVADAARSAAAHFHAAELAERAAERTRAEALYSSFISEFPLDSQVSLAWLRLGHVRRGMGRLDEAVDAYRQCRAQFPDSLNGARALLPLARTFLAQTPQDLDLAEKTLHLILDDSRVFTPEAREFADALFLLGDVLNRRGVYEEAVTRLEEALTRFPDAPQVFGARFILADSFRRSGLALKSELKDARHPGELEHMRGESRARLNRARELYRGLIDDYATRDPSMMSDLDRMRRRLAVLYEADCLFETTAYREAARLYEQATGQLADSTSSLAAYVQLINCHVFLGQPQEARAALTRAQVLARQLPDEAFARDASPQTRDDWQRYLRWLERSELF